MNPGLVKAGQYVKQRYESVPPQTRRRVRNIIIILILFLLFRNRISGAIRKLFHRDISKIEVDTSQLSYERGEYFSMCSTLESAMNGTGTMEESINEVIMRLRNQDDWNFLQKCFGVRKKDGGTFYSDITGDLKTWLADELDSGEMDEVNDILLQQGINY